MEGNNLKTEYEFDFTTVTCGNGIKNTGEECDDGNMINTDNCKNDCTDNVCGDGFLNSSVETCESSDSASCTSALGVDSSGTAPCNSTCTGWATASNCTRTYTCTVKPQNTETIYNSVSNYLQTWNGTKWMPEDDSNTDYDASESSTSCRYTCNSIDGYHWNGTSCIKCGNGDVEEPEQCDLGTDNGNCSICTSSCIIKPANFCGDGYRCGSEICEPGESTSCAAALGTASTGSVNCNLSCTGWMTANLCTRINTCPGKPLNSEWNSVPSFTQTWTGMIWSPADDKITEYNTDPSDTHCRFICTDGYAWSTLLQLCVPGGCGNGITEPGEECDDGNIINTDSCKNDCTDNFCGDGFLNSSVEVCERTDSLSCTSALGIDSIGTVPCNSTCTGWATASNCTRTYACQPKPQNDETIYNTVQNYTQTWNGTKWMPEDDSNTDYDTNGSTTSCRYVCNTSYTWDGASCNPPVCGNNIKESGEECDDGNETNNDNCRNNCTINRSPVCTGETLCYNNTTEITCPARGAEFFGQDAQYINECRIMSFTESGGTEKVITDNNTGLMWQKTKSTNFWNQAVSSCSNLTYGGYSDWRLPSISELETITDFGKSNPAVNTTFFPVTKYEFWSSTESIDYSQEIWGVDYRNGNIVLIDINGGMFGTYIDFRCVRGTSLPVHTFAENIIEGDAVVKDSATDLIWTKEYSAEKMNWHDALNYCEDLTYAGYTNWRLPNVNELKSLVDRSLYMPASSFPGMPTEYFWSSSSMTASASTIRAWPVSFYSGDTTDRIKTEEFYARCVRNSDPVDSLCGTELSICENGETTSCAALLGEGVSGSAVCNNSCDGWETAWNCFKTYICSEKPDTGTQWNTVSEYTQIWNGNSWKPDDDAITEYNVISNSNSCQYICADGYSWNGISGLCVVSDICGNGLVENGEECDDGNMIETDNCHNNCIKTTHIPFCTGQTKCYNDTDEIICPGPGSDFYGQDTQYSSICIPRIFTVSGSDPEEIVRDNNTRLEWQKTVSTDEYNWSDAKNYCDNLTYGGYSDWRLPTSLELGTLPDYGKINPAINTAFLPLDTFSQPRFWSSTSSNSSATEAWSVMFHYGNFSTTGITTEARVRCVRGLSVPSYTFTESTVEGKVIVTDTITELIWTKETASGKTWKNALSYCENLSYAGYTDWRLPNINELKTLLNHDIKYRPYSSFPGIPESIFWSSSAFEDTSATTAWAIYTISGTTWIYNKTNSYRTICVR